MIGTILKPIASSVTCPNNQKSILEWERTVGNPTEVDSMKLFSAILSSEEITCPKKIPCRWENPIEIQGESRVGENP